jgi:hypothetical protein
MTNAQDFALDPALFAQAIHRAVVGTARKRSTGIALLHESHRP